MHKLIDEVLEGLHEDKKLASGSGRLVYYFNDFVIKIPVGKTGINQSKLENEIYNNEKDYYTFLTPIYCYYRNCVVMKRLETIEDIKYIQSTIERYKYDLEELSIKYELFEFDLYEHFNWGFDDITKNYYLLDYGLSN